MTTLRGVLEHWLTLMLGRCLTEGVVRMTGWKLAEEAKLLPPIDKCPNPQPLISHEYFSLELQRGVKALLLKSCKGVGA